jgi:hypothetical protein
VCLGVSLVHWFVGLLVCLFTGWLIGWLAGWYVDVQGAVAE